MNLKVVLSAAFLASSITVGVVSAAAPSARRFESEHVVCSTASGRAKQVYVDITEAAVGGSELIIWIQVATSRGDDLSARFFPDPFKTSKALNTQIAQSVRQLYTDHCGDIFEDKVDVFIFAAPAQVKLR